MHQATAQANLWLHTTKRVARDESTLHSLTLSKEPLANENFAFFPLSCLNAAQGTDYRDASASSSQDLIFPYL